MRPLILLATLAVPASSFAQPPRSTPPVHPPSAASPMIGVDCPDARVQHARPGEPLRPRRLDELPPGALIHAVERNVGGCRELVLVSEERARVRR